MTNTPFTAYHDELKAYLSIRDVLAISFERIDDEGAWVIGLFGITSPASKSGIADTVSEIIGHPCIAASELEKRFSGHNPHRTLLRIQ